MCRVLRAVCFASSELPSVFFSRTMRLLLVSGWVCSAEQVHEESDSAAGVSNPVHGLLDCIAAMCRTVLVRQVRGHGSHVDPSSLL